MYTVQHNVGRVIEARLNNLRTIEDVIRFEGAMREAFDHVGGKSIVCADWRAAGILAPAVADRLVELLVRGNPRLERSAILLSTEHASFSLQVERVVREAGSPARRTFRDTIALVEWLAELLTVEERSHVNRFLAG